MSVDFRRVGLGREQIDYRRAWDLQREIHADVVAGRRGDTVLLLEHPPVYTAGRRTEEHERPQDGTPVVAVDRGGKITWHGPGQLVGYPIVALPEALGVVDYVRRLEEALIAALADYGIGTGRVRGRSGVWLAADPSTGSGRRPSINRRERKIAAIGVRVAGGVTMHGFAVNVDPDLGWFDKIVPCGLTDVGVTSVAAELGRAPSLTGFADVLEPRLRQMLAFEPYVQAPDLPRPDDAPTRPGLAVTV